MYLFYTYALSKTLSILVRISADSGLKKASGFSKLVSNFSFFKFGEARKFSFFKSDYNTLLAKKKKEITAIV